MSGYGQFCPVSKAAEVVAERWTPLLLRELLGGAHRFNELRRALPVMSPSLLSSRLKALERAGVVERRDGGYFLTQAGEELRPVVEYLGYWGRRWVMHEIEPGEHDPAIVMWDVQRRIHQDRIPAGRTVLMFDFADVKHARRYWWLVLEAPSADLCLTDPGYEVDLTVTTDVETFTRAWIGDFTIAEAVRRGAISVDGPRRLAREFPGWLALSPLTESRDRAATWAASLPGEPVTAG
ncbi:MAG: transcriptional regulator [Dehalococcoidia bacterium]|nr:transcriptional regulator [Dehalococcoidia bacterium]